MIAVIQRVKSASVLLFPAIGISVREEGSFVGIRFLLL